MQKPSLQFASQMKKNAKFISSSPSFEWMLGFHWKCLHRNVYFKCVVYYLQRNGYGGLNFIGISHLNRLCWVCQWSLSFCHLLNASLIFTAFFFFCKAQAWSVTSWEHIVRVSLLIQSHNYLCNTQVTYLSGVWLWMMAAAMLWFTLMLCVGQQQYKHFITFFAKM